MILLYYDYKKKDVKMQKFKLQSLVVLSIVVGSMSGVAIAGSQSTAIPGADTHSKNKVSTAKAIQSKLKYREGEVIVKYKNTINVQEAKSLAQSKSFKPLQRQQVIHINWFVLKKVNQQSS